jgi:hypothetical protein
MIADIYQQFFGSIYKLKRKRMSRDSLPDNHDLIQVHCCNLVILNVLAYKTSQNSIYGHLRLSYNVIDHSARSKIVDAPVTLIFGMG